MNYKLQDFYPKIEYINGFSFWAGGYYIYVDREFIWIDDDFDEYSVSVPIDKANAGLAKVKLPPVDWLKENYQGYEEEIFGFGDKKRRIPITEGQMEAYFNWLLDNNVSIKPYYYNWYEPDKKDITFLNDNMEDFPRKDLQLSHLYNLLSFIPNLIPGQRILDGWYRSDDLEPMFVLADNGYIYLLPREVMEKHAHRMPTELIKIKIG